MHEMALTRSVVDTVVQKAETAKASQVTSVTLTIGCMRDIVENLFEGLFAYLAKGTVAEGAELIIHQSPLLVKCDSCGLTYSLDVYESASWPCPVCEGTNHHVISGTEFRIDDISVIPQEIKQSHVA